jgi:hypothetical protein
MATYIPADKCVRTAVNFSDADGHVAQVRFHATYSGSAPIAANLTAAAGSVLDVVNTEWMTLCHLSWTSGEVVCTDLTSETSPEGTASSPTAGSLGGGRLVGSTSLVVSRETGRRYRGGHSRVYLPFGDVTKLSSDAAWDPAFVATAEGAYIDAEDAFATGAWTGAGAITSVMASFYSGFTNVPYGVPTKYRRVPTGRATAVFFPVLNYVGKVAVGSQRRRIRP